MKLTNKGIASDGRGLRWYGTAEWLSSAEGLKVAGSQPPICNRPKETGLELSEEVKGALKSFEHPVPTEENSNATPL